MSTRARRGWAASGTGIALPMALAHMECDHGAMAVFSDAYTAATVAAVVVLGVVARMSWLAARTWRAVRRLPVHAPSRALRAAAARAGVAHACLVRSGERAAFCAGLMRPRVHVTSGLVDVMGADELAAVLIHEGEHARRRDPVRRLFHKAVADVFICLPLLRWWSRDHIQRTELKADRAAIEGVGTRAVARALALAAASTGVAHATGFDDGNIGVRITQLQGGKPRLEAPSKRLIAASLAGLLPLGCLITCAGKGFATLFGM